MTGPQTHGFQSGSQSENRGRAGGAYQRHASQRTELIHMTLTLKVLANLPDTLQNTAVPHRQDDTGDKFIIPVFIFH